MKKLLGVALLVAVMGIAACGGGGGSDFVGNWEGTIDTGNPFQQDPVSVFTITHNTGNQYYITVKQNGQQIGGQSSAVFDNGVLKMDTGGTATIDSKSGELIMAGFPLKKVK